MSLEEKNKKIEKAVVGTYKNIEKNVVESYKKVEDGAVNSFDKMTDTFVDKLFRRDNETIEEAKKRLMDQGNNPKEKSEKYHD